MANRYWVGGTASWNGTAGTKWSDTSGGAGGFSVPTTADDVFFDANSGTNTVTIATGNTGAKSINCTFFTGNLNGTANITVAGSVTLDPLQFYNYTGTYTITGTGTLITAGKAFGNVTVNGSGITVTLGSALFATNIVVISGTLNTSASSYSISAVLLSIAVNGTLTLNGSTVSLSDNLSPFTCSFGTINAGTSQININGNNPTFFGNSDLGSPQTYYNVSFTRSTLYSTITGQNIFNNLTFTGNLLSKGLQTIYLTNNQTVNGTLTVTAGSSASCRTLFRPGSGSPSNKTLTCAAVSLTDVDFYNITGAGTASWTGTRIGNATGNSGITFAAAKTVYWNLPAGGDWSDTGWALSSGGTPNDNNLPLPQDTAVFESTGLNSGATITYNRFNFDDYVIGTINMSARTTNTMILDLSDKTPFIVGNWINGTGSSITGVANSSSFNAIIFGGISVNQNLTSAGQTIPVRIKIDAPSSTLTLQDNLQLSASGTVISFQEVATIQLANGTLNLNEKTLTLTNSSSKFRSYAGTKNITFNGSTISIFGAFDNAEPTNFTTTAGTGVGTIKMNNGGNFIGGGSTYNCTLDQAGSNTLTISGSNTFNNITNTYGATGATEIWFTAGTTQTVQDFTASGTSGKVLTIRSTGAGSAATLSKSSGTVSVDYVSIRDITATGGALWYAGINSTNVSGNTGWTFILPSSFLMFF